MFKQLRPALASLLVLSLVTGVAYPLLVTGIAQLAFPEQANGSLLRDAEGKVLGSRLIAQKFDGEEWFHSRPSAGDYATVSSAASNLAPSNPALAERIARDAAQERIADQGPVPLALVTTSGSGLDPQLPQLGLDSEMGRVLTVMAIGAGAMTVSHANDSFFWVVTQFSRMTVSTAYRAQTLATLVQGIAGMLAVWLLSLVLL